MVFWFLHQHSKVLVFAVLWLDWAARKPSAAERVVQNGYITNIVAMFAQYLGSIEADDGKLTTRASASFRELLQPALAAHRCP